MTIFAKFDFGDWNCCQLHISEKLQHEVTQLQLQFVLKTKSKMLQKVGIRVKNLMKTRRDICIFEKGRGKKSSLHRTVCNIISGVTHFSVFKFQKIRLFWNKNFQFFIKIFFFVFWIEFTISVKDRDDLILVQDWIPNPEI